jgi:hypothetical protein
VNPTDRAMLSQLIGLLLCERLEARWQRCNRIGCEALAECAPRYGHPPACRACAVEYFGGVDESWGYRGPSAGEIAAHRAARVAAKGGLL